MAKDDMGVIIQIHAYCKNDHFVIASHDSHSNVFHRDYFDFVHLSREVRKQNGSDKFIFPKERLKNLIASGSWQVNGTGWSPTMIKSLAIVNKWLQELCLNFPDCIKLFCNDDVRDQRIVVARKRKQNEASARHFQQYFTNSDTIDQMIELALGYGTIETGECSRLICIEPSCGDGRIVSKLAEQVEVHFVLGFELDSSVCKRAQQHCEGLHPNKCHIFSENFLQTSRIVLPQSIANNPQYPVVVIANPPYTAGGGTGTLTSAGDKDADTGRDLPLKFLAHAVREFGATRMVFLMPDRCRHSSFITRAHECFLSSIDGPSETTSASPGSIYIEMDVGNVMGASPIDNPKDVTSPTDTADAEVFQAGDWDVSHFHPRSSEFQFCNRVVKQSVVIQLWQKRDAASLLYLMESSSGDASC